MSSPTSVMAVVNWFAGCYKTGTQCGAAERISTDEYKLLVLKIKLALRPQHCQIVQQIVMATSLWEYCRCCSLMEVFDQVCFCWLRISLSLEQKHRQRKLSVPCCEFWSSQFLCTVTHYSLRNLKNWLLGVILRWCGIFVPTPKWMSVTFYIPCEPTERHFSNTTKPPEHILPGLPDSREFQFWPCGHTREIPAEPYFIVLWCSSCLRQHSKLQLYQCTGIDNTKFSGLILPWICRS